MKEYLGMENSHGYAFITDKLKDLGNAIQSLMPNAEHRYCVRYLYNNFKKKHSGLALKQTLWDATRSTSIPWWQAIMEKLKNEDLEAYKWLNTKPANNWIRSHFKEEFKCNILLNNLCEAFIGRYCNETLAGNMKYQVGTMSGREFAMDLATRRCTCKKKKGFVWNPMCICNGLYS